MSDQPLFRFYPNAYSEGGPFKRSDASCDICQREAVWLYTGGIYMEGESPEVCARCIADGSLRRKLPPDSFTLQDAILEEADGEYADEILYATPGVASINPFEWPAIDGVPLAYLGAGDEKALRSDLAVRAAIKAAFEGEDAHGSHALVFKQIDGPRIIAVPDLD